jgi:hypothetical protein
VENRTEINVSRIKEKRKCEGKNKTIAIKRKESKHLLQLTTFQKEVK